MRKLTRLMMTGVCLIAALAHAAPAPAPAGSAAQYKSLFDPALLARFPEMETTVKLVKINEPELAEYLANPDGPCTLFVATNEALQNSMKWLGKYAGKASQNKTLTRATLNYHVVPGQALTAAELGTKTKRALTRANQTVFFHTFKGGKPSVYGNNERPSMLNKTDIRAGKCVIHTIDITLVPPASDGMIQEWLEDVKKFPVFPKDQWAPKQEPLPGSIEAAQKLQEGSSAVAGAPAAGSATPAKSSAGGSRVGWMLCALQLVAVVVCTSAAQVV